VAKQITTMKRTYLLQSPSRNDAAAVAVAVVADAVARWCLSIDKH